MIEDNQYEEKQKKHKKIKITLRIVGSILLLAGIIFVIIAMVDFFLSVAEFNGRPSKMWGFLCGVPLIPIGTGLLALGFKKEMMGYIKNESVPIINELGQEVSPAIQNIAAAVKKGATKSTGTTCSCGQINNSESKFCKNCGKSLIQTCPNCNAQIDKDGKFCDKCGEKLK